MTFSVFMASLSFLVIRTYIHARTHSPGFELRQKDKCDLIPLRISGKSFFSFSPPLEGSFESCLSVCACMFYCFKAMRKENCVWYQSWKRLWFRAAIKKKVFLGMVKLSHKFWNFSWKRQNSFRFHKRWSDVIIFAFRIKEINVIPFACLFLLSQTIQWCEGLKYITFLWLTRRKATHTKKAANDITSSKGICCCLIPKEGIKMSNCTQDASRRRKKKEGNEINCQKALERNIFVALNCCLSWVLFFILCRCAMSWRTKEMCSHVLKKKEEIKELHKKKMLFLFLFAALSFGWNTIWVWKEVKATMWRF